MCRCHLRFTEEETDLVRISTLPRVSWPEPDGAEILTWHGKLQWSSGVYVPGAVPTQGQLRSDSLPLGVRQATELDCRGPAHMSLPAHPESPCSSLPPPLYPKASIGLSGLRQLKMCGREGLCVCQWTYVTEHQPLLTHPGIKGSLEQDSPLIVLEYCAGVL